MPSTGATSVPGPASDDDHYLFQATFKTPQAQQTWNAANVIATPQGVAQFYGASFAAATAALSVPAAGEALLGSSEFTSLDIEAAETFPPGWNENWTQMYGTRGGYNWFDEEGGEWHLHTPDSWHNEMHWDYNPWSHPYSPWHNVTLDGQMFFNFPNPPISF